jgi:hypothetical protein
MRTNKPIDASHDDKDDHGVHEDRAVNEDRISVVAIDQIRDDLEYDSRDYNKDGNDTPCAGHAREHGSQCRRPHADSVASRRVIARKDRELGQCS